MPGLSVFAKETYNFQKVLVKAATYTVVLADELVKVNGTYTMTLFVISTMQGTQYSQKALKFTNMHATGIATVSAGTGNTIGGRASIDLQPGESIVIEAYESDTDWAILDPYPLAPGIRNIVTLIATTDGTAVKNLVDASGSPVAGTIVDIQATAQDTFAGNIVVKNATNTISTIAKSTTAGLSVGAVALTTPAMAKGDLLTVESSTTNGNARVRVFLSTQTITKDG